MFGFLKKQTQRAEPPEEKVITDIERWLSKASAAERDTFKKAVCEAYDFAEAKGYSPACLFTLLAEIVKEMETTIAEGESKYAPAWLNGWRVVAGWFTLIPMKTSSSAQAALRAGRIVNAQFYA